jgi:hypothetical protein
MYVSMNVLPHTPTDTQRQTQTQTQTHTFGGGFLGEDLGGQRTPSQKRPNT